MDLYGRASYNSMEQLNISQLHGLVRTGLYEVGLKLTHNSMEQLNISQLHGLVRTGLYEVGLKLTGHTYIIHTYVRLSKVFQEWPPGGIATEM